MIYRFVTNNFCIVSDFETPTVLEPDHVTFTLGLEELATNTALLNALNLISMYAESYEKNKTPSTFQLGASRPATKEYCVKFMRCYLNDFLHNEPEITDSERLTVMVTSPELRIKILELAKTSTNFGGADAIREKSGFDNGVSSANQF